jgi:hypothetical protein
MQPGLFHYGKAGEPAGEGGDRNDGYAFGLREVII